MKKVLENKKVLLIGLFILCLGCGIAIFGLKKDGNKADASEPQGYYKALRDVDLLSDTDNRSKMGTIKKGEIIYLNGWHPIGLNTDWYYDVTYYGENSSKSSIKGYVFCRFFGNDFEEISEADANVVIGNKDYWRAKRDVFFYEEASTSKVSATIKKGDLIDFGGHYSTGGNADWFYKVTYYGEDTNFYGKEGYVFCRFFENDFDAIAENK